MAGFYGVSYFFPERDPMRWDSFFFLELLGLMRCVRCSVARSSLR